MQSRAIKWNSELRSADMILTTLPRAHQSHPTSHIQRKPAVHVWLVSFLHSNLLIKTHWQHRIAHNNIFSTFCVWVCIDMLHLPMQHWYFPSCHSHRGEQSRQADEKEQPVFVLKAKSWLPAWFSFKLSLGFFFDERNLTLCHQAWKTFNGCSFALAEAVYIPPNSGQVTLQHKPYFLESTITSLPWVTYSFPQRLSPINTLFIYLIILSHLATKPKPQPCNIVSVYSCNLYCDPFRKNGLLLENARSIMAHQALKVHPELIACHHWPLHSLLHRCSFCLSIIMFML